MVATSHLIPGPVSLLLLNVFEMRKVMPGRFFNHIFRWPARSDACDFSSSLSENGLFFCFLAALAANHHVSTKRDHVYYRIFEKQWSPPLRIHTLNGMDVLYSGCTWTYGP
ncbi:hypothetical protein QR680_018765 [Steinernema hermaphroditum]|uniref:Uncharacterized protein n=1 Tax=Steinernema hermaphroditum TaxID=289476 RepID=A0AA39LRK9_9BILA|nr:hypothetical protein QR680_018765 [Steinernema hermaphroditum]